MKLHRDAAPAIAPEAMTYYQTPATAPSTWRADLIKIGINAGIVGVVGIFLVISLYLLTKDLQIVGAGIWLTGLAIVGYLVWYAWGNHTDMQARRNLDLARMYAEQEALYAGKLDVDDDGAVKQPEIDRFVEYARRLHHPPGAPTTAAYAQTLGISGPDWQDYRDALIGYGYAHTVKNRGGPGFRLNDSVLRTPWPKLEKAMRERVRLGLGLTVTDSRNFDPEDVSTLGKS